MAKFKGIFEIEGTIQGMTFYKSKEGLLIRKKGGVSKSRIQNDPSFVRTRENGAEFGHNAQMARLLRNAVSVLVDHAKDGRLSARLNQVMNRVKNLDVVNVRGERTVHEGLNDPQAVMELVGFDFNVNSKLNQVLRRPFEIDTTDGTLSIQNFDPSKHLSLPKGTTHVQLSFSAAKIQFDQDRYVFQEGAASSMAIQTPAANLVLPVGTVPTGPGNLFYFLLIEFFQEVNGQMYPLKNSQFNVLNLVAME